jgi:restriction system protein
MQREMLKLTNSRSIKNSSIGYGSIENIWNVNRTKILRFQQEIWHEGLKEHKVISAPERDILNNKVRVQLDKWNIKWNEIQEKKRVEDIKKASAEEAIRRTKEAEERINEVENLLISTLEINHIIDWDALKNKSEFNEPYPIKPCEPSLVTLPFYPDKNAPEFQPIFNILTRLFKSLKNKAIYEAEQKYKSTYDEADRLYQEKIQLNNQLLKQHQMNLDEYEIKSNEWNKKKEEYIQKQKEFNSGIENFKQQYFNNDIDSVINYCDLVLSDSVLPDFINKEFDIDYNAETKILIIDYKLPEIEKYPNLKEVKYVASKNELNEIYLNSNVLEKLFDATIYKMVLRILYEEFQADAVNALDAISLNGWINYLNKATGNREDACIISIQVKKEAFNNIDLMNVDPKACFKNLKGVGSSKLAGITPIQPILTLNKNDKRFVESYNVSNQLDDSTNLAAIPWEDFEHLIRELFENEFSSNGGEVKVTQASRDGGVDAVAFDPDPIRGGKIVIQAKRYTNTVGVSAVRDLYGTVMNEGATKGILVTTADYGPVAYEFAKNKPLTLLNGGNLLHLLEKHGHKAKIDLKEARVLNNSH